jgi:hypothetical protein
MEVQVNRKWPWPFRGIDPDQNLSSGLRNRDLYVLNMKHGWSLIIVSVGVTAITNLS